MDNWYYMLSNEQRGPISLEKLRELIAQGQLMGSNFAWNESMPQWQPIEQIAELRTDNPSTSKAIESPINYYRGEMPPRAQATLKGHAYPLGDVGSWPLDDAMFAQFRESLRLRKRISSAVQLFRTLTFLAIIIAVIPGMMGIAAIANSRNGKVPGAIGIGLGTIVVFAFAALYWVLWRFTVRSHRWAPLVFFIVCIAGIVINLGSILLFPRSANMPGVLIGAIVTFIFGIAFAMTSWRAFVAIPKYLAQPAWCQELIAVAK